MPEIPQNQLVEMARRAAKPLGIPASLLYAIAMRESQGDPSVVGDQGKALGLFQVHPAAAKEMGYAHRDMLDPDKAIDAAGGYIAKMLHSFKDPRQAVSAYNAGPGKTRRAGGVAPSAQGYVNTVGGTIADVTAPGQPFADELSPEFSVPDAAHQDRIAKMLQGLMREETPLVPATQTSAVAPQYDDASIRRMLSAFRFNQ
jgi:hypothetical protein